MQKKLIALAIAGLSGAAFAQSNVTVYGVADVGFENVKSDGATKAADVTTALGATATPANQVDAASRQRVLGNSSYIGFKGVEDLGNGLKAIFQFETSFDPNGGNKTASGSAAGGATGQWSTIRDSYVGVAGGFGTLVLGTVTGPYRALGTGADFTPGAAGAGFTGSIYGEFLGYKTGSDDRTSNTVAYMTPNLSGFSGVLAYSANGGKVENQVAPKTNKDNGLWTLGANYAGYGFKVGYAYLNAKDPQHVASYQLTGAAAGSLNDKLTANRLTGQYDFGQGTSLTALYDKQKLEISGSKSVDAERAAWMIGAQQKFGAANTIWLEYAKANKLKVGGSDVNETGSKQVTLGYTLDLSKRTALKAYYSKITNESLAGYDFYNNGASATTQGSGVGGGLATVGADPRVIGASIRHNF